MTRQRGRWRYLAGLLVLGVAVAGGILLVHYRAPLMRLAEHHAAPRPSPRHRRRPSPLAITYRVMGSSASGNMAVVSVGANGTITTYGDERLPFTVTVHSTAAAATAPGWYVMAQPLGLGQLSCSVSSGTRRLARAVTSAESMDVCEARAR